MNMVAYEFYLQEDRDRRESLIGILPERRKNSKRIDEESIMRWGKMVLGARGDHQKIYYIQVKLD